MSTVDPDLPAASPRLWRADAMVLFDWLMSVDLNAVPVEHPAQRQALTDLLAQLEMQTDVTRVSAAQAVQWLAGGSLIDDDAASRFLVGHPDPDLPRTPPVLPAAHPSHEQNEVNRRTLLPGKRHSSA